VGMGLIKACMEISQWNPFVQLIYTNKKEKMWNHTSATRKY
jgi:hypothetical protein